MPDTEIRSMLERALPAHLPPSTVDAGAAVRAGRRQRHRRLAALAGVAVAVPAVLAAATVVLDRGPASAPVAGPGTASAPADGTGSGDGGETAPAPTGAAGPGLPAVAPARFDPLLRTLRVGWQPAGLRSHQWELTADRQSFGAQGTGSGDVGLYVSVFARGQQPPDGELAAGVPMESERKPTTPVRGRPAFCLADPAVPRSCSALRWEYAPGTWAQVSYASVSAFTEGSAPAGTERDATDPTAARRAAAAPGDARVVRRVAESLSLTAAERVRLPYRLTGRTGQLEPTRTLVEVRTAGRGSWGERWSASITLDTGPVPAGADLERRRRGITVEALDQPGGAADSPQGRENEPNTTVAGKPAYVSPDGAELVVRDRGVRVFVGVLGLPDRPADRYADVRLIADPTNPRDWVVPLS